MTKSDIQKLSLIASNCALPECHRTWLHEIIEREKRFMWHNTEKEPDVFPDAGKPIDAVCNYFDSYGSVVSTEYSSVYVNDEHECFDYVSDDYLFDFKDEVSFWRYIDTEETESEDTE